MSGCQCGGLCQVEVSLTFFVIRTAAHAALYIDREIDQRKYLLLTPRRILRSSNVNKSFGELQINH
jgi:hypothetical protein